MKMGKKSEKWSVIMRDEYQECIKNIQNYGDSINLPDLSKVKKFLKDKKRLKTLVRKCDWPLNDRIRNDLWKELSLAVGNKKFILDDEHYETHKLPPFVEAKTARFYFLNENGRKEVSHVLWAIFHDHPDIIYAPLLYPLCSLFLHFLNVESAYQSLMNLLLSHDLHFIGTTKADKVRDAYVLVKLTNKFGILPQRSFGAQVRTKLSQDATIDLAFAEYLQWIFVFLPFEYCVRIVDCFLIEGEKFLFRVALALALLFEQQNHEYLTLTSMRKFCNEIRNYCPTPQHLIQSAVSLTRISKNKIIRAKTKANLNNVRPEDDHHESPPQHDLLDVVITKRIAPRRFRSNLVSWSKLDFLWEWLPERCIVHEPVVVYYSDEHGNSLNTFFANCNDHEPTVLLIKTVDNEVFGAFCSSAWSERFEHSSKGTSYFGTGETFLFTLIPNAEKFDWVGKYKDHTSHGEELFMSANSKMIGIGSGSGCWGLWLDENLTIGQSDTCLTFANKPLAKTINFVISVIEVIAFC